MTPPELPPDSPEQLPDEPRFWNDYLGAVPICNDLVANFRAIREELFSFMESHNPLRDYPQISYQTPDNQADSHLYEGSWKAFPLSTFHEDFEDMKPEQLGFDMKPFLQWIRSACPFTVGLFHDLESQGNLANAFLSRIEPGTRIKPHYGWCFTYLRVQLGLLCDPMCRITVGDQVRTWEEGKLLAFKDGGRFPHSVWHQGTRPRIILSIDLRLVYLKKLIPSIF